MKFLLDENADRRLAPFLRGLGHDVTVISQDYPVSLFDTEVLDIAFREKRILITNDRGDFGELIFRQLLPHCGIILLRLKLEDANLALKKERLQYVLNEHTDQLQHFLVVTPTKIRIRKTSIKIAA